VLCGVCVVRMCKCTKCAQCTSILCRCVYLSALRFTHKYCVYNDYLHCRSLRQNCITYFRTAVLPYCHIAILPYCHIAILPYCVHTITRYSTIYIRIYNDTISLCIVHTMHNDYLHMLLSQGAYAASLR
jgi:hypothetical protein